MKQSKEKSTRKGAPIGNDFWRLVQVPGRPKKYTPQGLWRKALQYFEWCTKNPLKEKKVFGTGYSATINRSRPFTETAFCLFAGIDKNTFQRYKSGENYKDFWAVSEAIEKTIYVQKFEGAAVDFFNGSIIARDLGLVDKQSMDIDFDNLSDENVIKIARHLINLNRKNRK